MESEDWAVSSVAAEEKMISFYRIKLLLVYSPAGSQFWHFINNCSSLSQIKLEEREIY